MDRFDDFGHVGFLGIKQNCLWEMTYFKLLLFTRILIRKMIFSNTLCKFNLGIFLLDFYRAELNNYFFMNTLHIFHPNHEFFKDAGSLIKDLFTWHSVVRRLHVTPCSEKFFATFSDIPSPRNRPRTLIQSLIVRVNWLLQIYSLSPHLCFVLFKLL